MASKKCTMLLGDALCTDTDDRGVLICGRPARFTWPEVVPERPLCAECYDEVVDGFKRFFGKDLDKVVGK
jgi:hypothetical protein